jgi:uncharacterized membrane protein
MRRNQEKPQQRVAVSAVLDASLAGAHNTWIGLPRLAGKSLPWRVTLFMIELFRHPLFTAALWFAAIFALLALAIALVRRFRGGAAEDRPTANELLTKFRDLHARGGLSDDEYRTIKTKLATQLQTELTHSEKTS